MTTTTQAPRQPSDPPVTYLPREQLAPLGDEPQRVRIGASAHERLSPPGAIVAAVALALLLGPMLGLYGAGWVPILSFLFFLVAYTVLISITEDGRAVQDRFWQVLLWSAGAAVTGLLTLVIGFVLVRSFGIVGSLRWSFITTDMRLVDSLSPLTEGGILHAIVGTVEQIGIALLITIPLGTTTALFLNEIGGRFARFVRTIVEAMTALPSVVAGLFIYATVILLFTKQFSGFAAALSITVLMLPIMIRSSDVVLRLVPGNLREAGLALGGGQWAVVRRVVLPTVRSGLVTAIILGTAHGIGETAPVLLTAGANSNLNLNPFDGPQVSLPLAALQLIKAGQPDTMTRGFATAAFLLLLVLVLFVLARILGGQQAGEVTQRQLRRLLSRSRRDQSRVEANYAAVLAHLAEARGEQPHRPPGGTR